MLNEWQIQSTDGGPMTAQSRFSGDQILYQATRWICVRSFRVQLLGCACVSQTTTWPALG